MGGSTAGPRLDDAAWAATFDGFARRHLDLAQMLVDDPDDTGARRALADLDAEIAAAAARYAAAAPNDGHVRWFPTALLDASPMAAALVELFPTRVRYTALSVPYHIGIGWVGGFMPMTAFAIATATGDVFAGLWYPVVFGIIGIVTCLFLFPETKGRPLT